MVSPHTRLLVSNGREDFERLFNHSPELLCIAGFDGYFKRLNPAWEKTLGFSPEHLTSVPYLDFVHPDDRALTEAEAEKLSDGEPTVSFENRYRCRDGSFRWLLWCASPDPGQQRIFASARDITARKRAEQRLAAGYAVTRVLSNCSSLAEAVPRFLQGICETLGWEMGAFWQVAPGQGELRCLDVWHPGSSPHMAEFEAVTRNAAFGPGFGLPGRVWSEDRPVWLKNVLADRHFPRAYVADEAGLRGAVAFPIHSGGEVTGVMEFFDKEINRQNEGLLYMFAAIGSQIGQFIERNRNDQRIRDYAASLEETRREQEEVSGRLTRLVGELAAARSLAEEGTRAKSDFLARMSHEIRTPMTAIMGMTELALRTPLSSEQREYLETIDESSNALLRLINGILDFSKIEAHQLELDHTDFALRDTVEGALKTLFPRAREKRLELTCRISRDVPDRLIGDPNRLRQILLNLLANAVKFTDQGEVALRVNREAKRANTVVLHFAVCDTGIGVPVEMQNAIFDSFAQADTSITRQYGGTGLGLAIAAQLVALMGGRLWVESRQGKGSRFHFTAHFNLAKRHARSRRDNRPPDLRELPVLVVDHGAAARRNLCKTIRQGGMKPSGAANASEALARVKHAARSGNPYRLVLIDAEMLKKDGFHLARRIRLLPFHRHTPLILLASAKKPVEPVRVRRLQPTACLIRPFKRSELWDIVRASLRADPGPSGKSRPAAAPPARKPLSVLVAEDNPVNQRLLQLLLEKMGYRAVLARNGEEAISAAMDRQVDLVLMDVEMPVLSGVDATRAIRARDAAKGTHLPIIAMTAHAMKGDKERCLAAGMDAYIPKPIQSDVLNRMIRRFAPSPISVSVPSDARQS